MLYVRLVRRFERRKPIRCQVTVGRTDNNPVNFSEEDVEQILAEVF
jgi:hypothetical protein